MHHHAQRPGFKLLVPLQKESCETEPQMSVSVSVSLSIPLNFSMPYQINLKKKSLWGKEVQQKEKYQSNKMSKIN